MYLLVWVCVFFMCCYSVQFRTTPMDSTGVPHILEHTVLCGSQRFPCRDPFFKMLNRSLSTFMNAFTGTFWSVFVFKCVYVCVICISDYVNFSHQRAITRCTRSPPRIPKTSRTFCQSIWMLSSSHVSENWTSGKGHDSETYSNSVCFPWHINWFWKVFDVFFRQEGWRLEHETPTDPSSRLVFKGVVFNEMKGVFVRKLFCALPI